MLNESVKFFFLLLRGVNWFANTDGSDHWNGYILQNRGLVFARQDRTNTGILMLLFLDCQTTKKCISTLSSTICREWYSWRVFDHLSAEGTRQILIEAAQYLTSSIPDIILVDGGPENRVEKYGDTLQWAKERMWRAWVDIAYLNSMIEAFWRKRKHSYLFKYNLDSLATVKRLIAKFIDEYNTLMPHSAFRGQTPAEIYFGIAPDIEKHLAEERTKAREKRIEFNRALSCDACNIDFNQLYSSNKRGEDIELQN